MLCFTVHFAIQTKVFSHKSMEKENKSKSFPEERRKHIRSLLEENGRVSVDELTLRFQVSKVTIRGDLDSLERDGLVRRTHGGAIFVSSDIGYADPPFIDREQAQSAEKLRIGKAAAALIQSGDIVFLDAGTTALNIAKHLRHRVNITIVTIGLRVAMELEEAEGVTVVVPGGVMRRGSMSLLGDYALRTLESIHVNKAFMGAKGLTLSHGLTDVNAFEVATKKFVVQRADQVIGVADHSKWGRVSFATFAQTEQIAAIISDSKAPPDLVEQLRARGVRVDLA